MQIDINFYRDWFSWVEKKTAQLAKNGDLLGLAAYTSEAVNVSRQLVGLWGDLTDIFSGHTLSIITKAVKWSQDNPDPLKPIRQSMRDMRAKYGEVEAAVPSPAATAAHG